MTANTQTSYMETEDSIRSNMILDEKINDLTREIDIIKNVQKSKQVLEDSNTFNFDVGEYYAMKEEVEQEQLMKDNDPFSEKSFAFRGLSWNIMYLDTLIYKYAYLENALNYKSIKTFINGIDLNISYETTKDNLLSSIITNRLANKYKKPLTEFAWLGAGYGGSGLLFMINNSTDREEMLTPLNYTKLKKGDKFSIRPLTRLMQIQPDYSMPDTFIDKIGVEEGIYDDTELGKPKYYRVSIVGDMIEDKNGKKVFSNKSANSFLVHRSRLGIYNGNMLSYISRQLEGFFGVSLPAKALDSMRRYNETLLELMKLLKRANIPVYNMDGITTLGRDNKLGREKQDKAILSIARSQKIGGLVVIGSVDKEDFKYIQADFDKLNDELLSRKKELASDMKVPLSVAFNEKDENDEMVYDFDIQNIQERQIRPLYNQIIPIIAMIETGEILDINSFSFKFRSLEQTTEKQKAETLKLAVDMIVDLVETNVIDISSAQNIVKNASYNINDMFNAISDEFMKKFEGKGITKNYLQIELANALNNQSLENEIAKNNDTKRNRYNMAETKVKGNMLGGSPRNKKPSIDINDK